jgi:protease I
MKSFVPGKRFIFGMIVSLLILSTSSGVLSQVQGKKVVMVVPLKDFWDIELTTVKEIFEENGLMVTIASSTLKEAKGMFGTK